MSSVLIDTVLLMKAGGGGVFRNNVILIYSFVGSDRFSSDLMDHDRLAVFSIMDPDVGITLKGGTR